MPLIRQSHFRIDIKIVMLRFTRTAMKCGTLNSQRDQSSAKHKCLTWLSRVRVEVIVGVTKSMLLKAIGLIFSSFFLSGLLCFKYATLRF